MYPKGLYLKVVSVGIICEDTKKRSIGTHKTLTLRAEGEQLLVIKLISGLLPHHEFDQEPDLFSSHLMSLFPCRGDQTSAEAFLTVLPRGMECVVFSIDGSFAASVSIMGSDPKVRPGAVDVVR